jgi:uncharacterized protein
MVQSNDSRYANLLGILRSYGRVLVAYSGGTDSTLVVRAASEALGAANVLAATGISASLAPREREGAAGVLAELGLAGCHRLIETGEQDISAYRRNHPDRCFHCKTELYTRLSDLARNEGYTQIANGANLDDLDDFRPGMDAARELDVKSPLVEARLTKADVREIARAIGLPNWDKPAAPCLASRVPHGREVNPDVLVQVARAEAFLQDLGLSGFRVRHHGDLARIELPSDAWAFFDQAERREKVEAAFRDIGFRYVALDLGGYKQGKAVIR